MKVAFICEPLVGGPFSFFIKLRASLLSRGIDIRCVSPISLEFSKENVFRSYDGVESLDLRPPWDVAMKQLLAYLNDEKYDVVLTLPGCDVLGSNLPCYLPHNIKCIARVPLASRGSYRPVKVTDPYYNHIVAVCDRIAEDLSRYYDILPDQMSVIPNGVDTTMFKNTPPSSHRMASKAFKLVYAGRIENLQKNVLLLPKILRQVVAIVPEVELHIIGSGPDKAKLTRLFEVSGLNTIVFFHDGLTTEKIKELYMQGHCFVFPTRYEGCPNALLEAMAGGCVPVSSRIQGVTTSIIENNINGFLVPVGNAQSFAGKVTQLALDRSRWRTMSKEASRHVNDHFPVERMALAYKDVLERVLVSKDSRIPPHPIDDFVLYYGLKPLWSSKLPVPLKNLIRNVLSNAGITIK